MALLFGVGLENRRNFEVGIDERPVLEQEFSRQLGISLKPRAQTCGRLASDEKVSVTEPRTGAARPVNLAEQGHEVVFGNPLEHIGKIEGVDSVRGQTA